MMSRKTLCGLPTTWTQAFPRNEEVADIFEEDQAAILNVLHYADYAEVHFEQCLRMASAYGGRKMQAIQLDMRWPDVGVIREYRSTQRDIWIILQIGRQCFDDVGDDPEKIARRLEPYAETVDAVLLDRSMGSGTLLDPAKTLPHLRRISAEFPKMGLAIAGGLGPETVDIIKPILAEFPQVSIDAQGRLRRSGKSMDPIEWDLAETYLRRAIALFQTPASSS
jgi:phosphoribosylanthranilate isomerase